MTDVQDHSTLKWIRPELDQLVEQARHRLEAYVEDPDDGDAIEECIKHLHQIRGTLQLMQLYGAAMLAEEMALVATAIRDGQVRRRQEAAETLMLGMVHLPDYLEKLEGGSRDIPLLILPMLNEMRAARDAALLSEVALFAPELEQRLQQADTGGEPNPKLPALAKRLRLRYHKGLLEWYRETDVEGGLRHIAGVLEELEMGAGTEVVRHQFQAGRAVAEGLREGSVESGIAVKELFGRLDRVVKQIIDEGEQAAAEAATGDMMKNLLYYVASADSDNPVMQVVKQEFALDKGFLDRSEIERERQGLEAPGHQLMDSLRSAIDADLVRIKDALDLYIRGQGQDLEQLVALKGPMQTVADTLGMIGQGGLRQRLLRQVERIDEAESEGAIPDEQALLAMAGDILYVEASLENLATLGPVRRVVDPAEESGLSALPAGEFERLIESVMHEAQVDIARNKEAIIDFIASPDRPELLDGVSHRFQSVAGAFRIMNLTRAAELLEGLSRYVDETLSRGGELPSEQELNRFADATTAIEYFMEAVTDGRGVRDEILDVAVEALAELGLASPTLSVVEEDGEPAAEPVSGEEVAEVAVEPTAPADAIDPEILEIFVEEAQEELAVIGDYLPRWCDNTDDREALSTFRRSFHTLKGSGRLVGAETIGEFAWSIENLLNRVIDETVPISPEIVTLLRETMDVLPDLIASQAEGRAPARDVTPLMERAFALASPGATPETPAAPAERESAEVAEEERAPVAEVVPFPGAEEAAGEPVQDEPPLKMDPGLLEIFGPETRGHVEELRAFTTACRREPAACDLTNSDVGRALHTLHGSADMAGVRPIAALSSALETLVGELADHGHHADESLLELIDSAAGVVEGILDAINRPGAELPDWQDLIGQADAWRQRLHRQPAATAEETKVEAQPDGEAQPAEADAPEAAVTVDQHETTDAVVAEPVADGEGEVAGTATPEAEEEGGAEAERAEPVTEPVAEEPPAVAATDPAEAIAYDPVNGDEELTEIFLEEAHELLEAAERDLQAWRQEPDNTAHVAGLERTLHTLKGGARLAGVTTMGDLCHQFESLLSGVATGSTPVTPELQTFSLQVIDRLAEQIEDLSRGPRVRRVTDLLARLEHWGEEPPETVTEPAPAAPEAAAKEPAVATPEQESETVPEQPVAASQPEPEVVSPEDDAATAETPVETVVSAAVETATRMPAAERARSGRREQIRVQADLLDRLVNNAGEVSIYRSRLEQQNGALGFNLQELEQTVERLRNQLRKLEIETEAQILFRYDRTKQEGGSIEEAFDPLELDRFSTMQQLSRSLMETVNDLSNINDYLEELHKENDTLLQQQARVATDLQDGLLRTRMVPFSQLVPRLQRVVRQTANALDKKAELEVHGAEGELDRGILDRMIGPLEHLLRNAVSHGIEPAEERRAAGKPEGGRITLFLRREGNDVLLTVSDDGRGLDIQKIRQHAIEMGLLDARAEVPESDILQFVLEHGFSTQSDVDQISGRGVGLDVVVREVKQLGGSLDINSRSGQGTSFVIRLPLTLAISDALLVELGEEIYAISHASIEGVVRVGRQELQECYDGTRPAYEYAGHAYSVRYLGAMLGVGQLNLAEQRKWYPLLLVRAGDHHVALQVDGLLGNRQIVVKSVGPQVSSVRWISGGTILGDGRVALILDVTALVRMDAAHKIPDQAAPERTEGPAAGRTIMVVDDSITVRKVTGRVLERNGMTVITAKDGVDAVALLQEHHPDLMLLDIEMPRMDGYELARHMRNTEQLKEIPIIMITSRTGDKHRRLAMELGVKRYLGKPYQEAELLQNIDEVLAEVQS